MANGTKYQDEDLDSIYARQLPEDSDVDAIYGVGKPTSIKDVYNRFIARGTFPEDTGRRESLLGAMGTNPIETKGWGKSLADPELYADIGETAAPFVKYGLGAVGAAAGAVAATPASAATLNPVPSLAGGALGGAAGYMLADKGFRALAGGKSTLSSDIEAGATGALNILGGNALGVGSNIVVNKAKDLVTKAGGLGSLIEKHLVVDVSGMPSKAYETLKSLGTNAYTRVKNLLPGSSSKLTSFSEKEVIPAVNAYRRETGDIFARETNHIVNDPENIINFNDIIPSVVDKIQAYRSGTKRLTKAEVSELLHLFSPLIKVINPRSKAVQSGKYLPLEEGYADISLRKTYDVLNRTFDDVLVDKYAAAGEAGAKNSTFIAAAKEIRRILKDHIHTKYNDLQLSDLKFQARSDLWEDAITNFGTVQKANDFIGTKYFDTTGATDLGRRAIDEISSVVPDKEFFTKEIAFQALLDSLQRSRSPRVSPSFTLPIINSVIGGAIGAAMPAQTNRERIRNIGVGSFLAGQGTRAFQVGFQTGAIGAVNTMAMVEGAKQRLASMANAVRSNKVSKDVMDYIVKPTKNALNNIIRANKTTITARIVGKPVADAVKNMVDAFGMDISNDELRKQLK